MQTDRREFLGEIVAPWKRALGLLGVAVVLSHCSSSSPTPSAPTSPTTPPSAPKATSVPATGSYKFELVANETVSVLDALTAVNLNPQTNTHTSTPGPFVEVLGGIASSRTGGWLLHRNGNWFGDNVAAQLLSKGDRLGCLLT